MFTTEINNGHKSRFLSPESRLLNIRQHITAFNSCAPSHSLTSFSHPKMCSSLYCQHVIEAYRHGMSTEVSVTSDQKRRVSCRKGILNLSLIFLSPTLSLQPALFEILPYARLFTNVITLNPSQRTPRLDTWIPCPGSLGHYLSEIKLNPRP